MIFLFFGTSLALLEAELAPFKDWEEIGDDFICENQWQNKRRFGSIIFVSRSPDLRDLPASIIVTKYVTQSNLYIKDGHGW